MKVSQCSGYDPQFPEKFNWGLIESHKLTSATSAMRSKIESELLQSVDKRIHVSGLRLALQIIAEIADV